MQCRWLLLDKQAPAQAVELCLTWLQLQLLPITWSYKKLHPNRRQVVPHNNPLHHHPRK